MRRVEYDKAAVQDISLPESHPFGCRLHARNCSEIKGKSNSAANQATDRLHPSAEVSADIILYKSCRYKNLLTVFMGKKKVSYYRYGTTYHTKGVKLI